MSRSSRNKSPLWAGFACLIGATLSGACSSEVVDDPRSAQGASIGATVTPGATPATKGAPAGTNTTSSPLTPGGPCAQGRSSTLPMTPTVWLVVDASSSMGERFSGSTRWAALRSALMATDGVVATLQNVVRFGLVLYSGPLNPDGGGGARGRNGANNAGAAAPTLPAPAPAQCETVMVVNPALSNYAAIDAAYPQVEVGGSTPTHRALERVVTTLPVVNKQVPDAKEGPIYVILATDGAPNDFCADAGGGGGARNFDAATAMRVVEVVTQGVQMGMHMFVVSLAGDDTQTRQHLQQVAAIGSPGQMPFEPSTKDELVSTLQQLVGGATCQLGLEGKVAVGQECSGEVSLNGEHLTCNIADGWRLVDDHTLQLTGKACESFLMKQSMVNATFPCGVFVPQ